MLRRTIVSRLCGLPICLLVTGASAAVVSRALTRAALRREAAAAGCTGTNMWNFSSSPCSGFGPHMCDQKRASSSSTSGAETPSASSPSVPPLKPCAASAEQLQKLWIELNKNKVDVSPYFLDAQNQAWSTNHYQRAQNLCKKFNIDLNDTEIRCTCCGVPINQHRSSAAEEPSLSFHQRGASGGVAGGGANAASYSSSSGSSSAAAASAPPPRPDFSGGRRRQPAPSSEAPSTGAAQGIDGDASSFSFSATDAAGKTTVHKTVHHHHYPKYEWNRASWKSGCGGSSCAAVPPRRGFFFRLGRFIIGLLGFTVLAFTFTFGFAVLPLCFWILPVLVVGGLVVAAASLISTFFEAASLYHDKHRKSEMQCSQEGKEVAKASTAQCPFVIAIEDLDAKKQKTTKINVASDDKKTKPCEQQQQKRPPQAPAAPASPPPKPEECQDCKYMRRRLHEMHREQRRRDDEARARDEDELRKRNEPGVIVKSYRTVATWCSSTFTANNMYNATAWCFDKGMKLFMMLAAMHYCFLLGSPFVAQAWAAASANLIVAPPPIVIF